MNDEEIKRVDMPDSLIINQTSKKIGCCYSRIPPIPISESPRTRMLFEPMFNEKESTLKGHLIYERRSGEDKDWPNTKDCTRGSVKANRRAYFELHSEELLGLYDAIRQLQMLIDDGYDDLSYRYIKSDFSKESLYKIFSEQRLPRNIDPELKEALCLLTNPDYETSYVILKLAKMLPESKRIDALEKLIAHLSEMDSEDVHALLETINEDTIKILQEETCLKRMFDFKNNILKNINSVKSEELVWQNLFTENRLMLSQLFTQPLTMFVNEAVVGGSDFTRTGSRADYIFKNDITKNTTLVEIKTPSLNLMYETPYRKAMKIYSVSSELSGAIIQVSKYKNELIKNYNSKRVESGLEFEALDPNCVIIAGNLSKLNDEQQKSFELFRNRLHGIEIVTFDEVVARIDLFIKFLKSDSYVNSKVACG